MDSFSFWLDRPFDPRRPAKRTRRQSLVVTIRYQGSVGRSAVKALIVLALLAVIASFVGERSSPNLDANEVTTTAASAGTQR